MGKIAVGRSRSFDVIWYLGRSLCMMIVMLYVADLLSKSHRAGASRATRPDEYLCGPLVPVTDGVRFGCMGGQSNCKKWGFGKHNFKPSTELLVLLVLNLTYLLWR
jgi:hypothetical protein